MSNPSKTIDNRQSLGTAGTALSVNSDITFNGGITAPVNSITASAINGLSSYARLDGAVFTGSVTLPANSITASSINGISSYARLDGSTFTGPVTLSNVLTTQALVYETVNATGGSVNAYTINYASGGLFAIGTGITPTTAPVTLAVTGIPTDTTKSYTFTVLSTQSSRYYINTVQIQDTASAYITNGGIAGFVAPLFNGGTPSLSGTTSCVIAQQFTVITVGNVRKVICSVSCCT